MGAATVLSPTGPVTRAEVVVEDGLIVEVRQARRPVPDVVLAPGFVDLQVNGIGAVDVATATGSDWDTLDAALLAQGVTTWCPTLVTAPLDALAASLGVIAEASRRPPRGRPHIAGAHVEGPFLAVRGAHRPEFVRDHVDGRWLDSVGDLMGIVTIAPELPGALGAVRALSERGVLVSLGHSACTAEEARDAVDAGARLVTHLGNAMGPLHHRAPGLLGAALADPRVSVSVIADLVHTHPVFVQLAMAAKGPQGVALVTDAVATAGVAAGTRRRDAPAPARRRHPGGLGADDGPGRLQRRHPQWRHLARRGAQRQQHTRTPARPPRPRRDRAGTAGRPGRPRARRRRRVAGGDGVGGGARGLVGGPVDAVLSRRGAAIGSASMPFAAAMSEHPLTAHAAGEVTGAVLERIGDRPDFATVFVTPPHAGRTRRRDAHRGGGPASVGGARLCAPSPCSDRTAKWSSRPRSRCWPGTSGL